MAFVKFTEGPAKRPDIHHDHGFLDDGKGNIDPTKRRLPTWQDYKLYVWWSTKLDGAEFLRPDLADATKAYSHFLDATGVDMSVNYEMFLASDAAGQTALKSAIEDTTAGAIEIHDKKLTGSVSTTARQDEFSITSDAIGVGGRDARYPYPKTENWQKAIGAHFIWMDAAVKVKIDPAASKRQFEVKMHIHMEDMYNFNPGAHDIATGTPDSDNGRFELCGLAKEFLSKGDAFRTLRFTEPMTPVPDTRVKPADLDVSTR